MTYYISIFKLQNNLLYKFVVSNCLKILCQSISEDSFTQTLDLKFIIHCRVLVLYTLIMKFLGKGGNILGGGVQQKKDKGHFAILPAA